MTERATFAARLTPERSAGLATLGVVGPAAASIVEALFRSAHSRPLPYDRPLYGDFGDAVLDDVVLHLSHTPVGSLAHIHCHGGVAMTTALIDAIAGAGGLVVDWREFECACGSSFFCVDALAALARAETERTAAILLDQLNGALDAAHLAAQTSPAVARRVLSWASLGKALTRPFRAALFGRANAGKSSLLNALIGYQRAIVTPTPGTTRDVVRATTALDGWPVEFVDGAGFRPEPSRREREGIHLLEAELDQCNLRILVLDRSVPDDPEEKALRGRFLPQLVVANKGDLPAGRSPSSDWLVCSATEGIGIRELAAAVCNQLVPNVPVPGEAIPFMQGHVRLFEQLK